jgi:hypothetical protein
MQTTKIQLTTSSNCIKRSADFRTRCVVFLYSSSQLHQDITTSNKHSLGCNGLSTITIIVSDRWFRFMVFNTTFNTISTISWWSVLLVEETRVPGENHKPIASHRHTLSHNVVWLTPRHERGSKSQL